MMMRKVLRPQTAHAFGGEDPAFGGPWYHEVITRAAANAAGWRPRASATDDGAASESLSWVADYIDSYLYNPVWWAAGGWGRFKASLLVRNELIKLHFDDLTSNAQIRTMWLRYQAGTVAALLWAARRGDVGAARNAVGVSLHAMQDFYSHSNWVDDRERRERTWFDAAWARTPVRTAAPIAEAGTLRSGLSTMTRRVTELAVNSSAMQALSTRDVQVDPAITIRPPLTLLADPRPTMHLFTGTYEQHEQHGFAHHGKIAFDCTLMRNLGVDVELDLLCTAMSPAANTGLCRRWRECRSGKANAAATNFAGVPLPAGTVYLAPAGIALDSVWMSRISIRQRQIASDDPVTPEALFAAARTLAERTSVQWLDELARLMTAAGHATFWSQVMTRARQGVRSSPIDAAKSYLGGYSEDITQFEQPWRHPFRFLSAGAYPPVADQRDDDKWWLRLELHTSDVLNAGTDADIRAFVTDGPSGPVRSYLLDHGHERTPSGGFAENRLLEWNDFERGDKAVYVVGPFTALPTRLELRNTAASLGGVLKAAWDDLSSAVGKAVEDIGTILLSIIGGNADRVGATKQTWSWAQIEAAAAAGGSTHTLRVDGRSEGIYDITLRLTAVMTATGASVTVRFTRLKCIKESTWDRGSSSDEPFVLALVNSPAQPQLTKAIFGPYSDVDTGEHRDINRDFTVTVPRYGGVIVPIQIWESDDESSSARTKLLDEFASQYGAKIANPRSKFLDALGSTIAPDWRLKSVDAVAFKRGRTVEVAELLRNQQVEAWINAGTSRHFGLAVQHHQKAFIQLV